MKLDQALKKIGATVVKTEKRADGSVSLMLRLGKPQGHINPATLWATTVQEFVLAGDDKRVNWKTDVSKVFFAKDGGVLFLWRVILLGDVLGAAEALGLAAIRAISQSVEVTSMPLIGRETPDLAHGKIKGAHDSATAANILAAATRGP